MKTMKQYLWKTSLIVSVLLMSVVANAAIPIELEKDIFLTEITRPPGDVTFNLSEGGVVMASQTFPLGAWSADLDLEKYKTSIEDIVRFKVIFTSTESLETSMNLSVGIELDGVPVGTVEEISPTVWSLFVRNTEASLKKCSSQQLVHSFYGSGSFTIYNQCIATMPEASAGAVSVWSTVDVDGGDNMTGDGCAAGNVAGSHSGTLVNFGETASICHNYCTLIADCNANGEWVNIRHTW